MLLSLQWRQVRPKQVERQSRDTQDSRGSPGSSDTEPITLPMSTESPVTAAKCRKDSIQVPL